MDFSHTLSAGKSNRLETTVWAAKLVFLIMGIVSTVILFKVVIVSFSYTLTFIFSTFPPLLISARSLLSPPFLYVLVNFIIITIAVSSNFHSQNRTSSLSPSTNPESADSSSSTMTEDAGSDDILEPTEKSNDPNEDVKEETQLDKVAHDSALSSDKLETNLPLEKFSGDFISPDSDEQHDDMESTWNSIMETQGKPEKLKLKKSETWAERAKAESLNESLAADNDHVARARRELKKSDTFNDTTSLRRDKSMSQEELYSKAEAFIQKINNQIRLQRMESDQRFMEMDQMVDSGVSHYYLVESSI